MTVADIEPLIDARGAAEVLNIAYRTVHELRKSGVLPAVAIGGVWRFDPADIREFITKQKGQLGDSIREPHISDNHHRTTEERPRELIQKSTRSRSSYASNTRNEPHV